MASRARTPLRTTIRENFGQRRIVHHMSRVAPVEVRESADHHPRNPRFVDKLLPIVTPLVIP